MYHHDGRDYQVAARAAADYGRGKFESMLAEGRARSAAVLQRVMDERPADSLVPAARLTVDLAREEPWVRAGGVDVGRLHPNALQQLAGRAGVPLAYIQKLQGREEPWARELAEENFRRLLEHQEPSTRYLMRSVNGQVRGVLSDSYKRLDMPSILESYVGAASALGAVPIDAVGSDLRLAMRFALPTIHEPMPHEVMVYGVELRSSDYGVGSLGVTFFMLRVTCTNLATGSDALRRVHLGARLTDEAIQYSARTMELDAAAVCSAMGDTITHLLGDDHIRKVNVGLAAAGSDKLGMGQVQGLLKEYLGKKDAEQAAETFQQDQDIINLPTEPTRWRLSNLLSLMANREPNAEKKLDLQDAAGKVLGKFMPVAFA
jgi:hypothetical protein